MKKLPATARGAEMRKYGGAKYMGPRKKRIELTVAQTAKMEVFLCAHCGAALWSHGTTMKPIPMEEARLAAAASSVELIERLREHGCFPWERDERRGRGHKRRHLTGQG